MAKNKGTGDPSSGPLRVALLAFRDRAFFERLLKNPRDTLDEVGDELRLSDDDKDQVEKMVERRLRDQSVDELRDLMPDPEIWKEDFPIWPEIC